MDVPSPQSGNLLAVVPVALFVAWALARRLRPAEAFLTRHLRAGAVVSFVLVPAATYGAGLLALTFANTLGLASWQAPIREVTELLISLAIATGVARLIEVWIVSRDVDGEDTRLPQLARNMIYGISLFVGLVAFLAINGYTSDTLLVSTGVGAAIIVFAMQQTLGDLFSGIALSLERPFRIGDWLRLSDGSEGEVIDMNWRATQLRGWDNTTRVVPNGLLSRQSFTNLHGPKHLFAPWYFVRVSGDADPQDVKALLEEAARRSAAVLPHPAPVARLTDGMTNPHTYMVWVHFANYPSMFVGREELYREIRSALRAAGLEAAVDIHEVRHRPMETTPTIAAAATR